MQLLPTMQRSRIDHVRIDDAVLADLGVVPDVDERVYDRPVADLRAVLDDAERLDGDVLAYRHVLAHDRRRMYALVKAACGSGANASTICAKAVSGFLTRIDGTGEPLHVLADDDRGRAAIGQKVRVFPVGDEGYVAALGLADAGNVRYDRIGVAGDRAAHELGKVARMSSPRMLSSQPPRAAAAARCHEIRRDIIMPAPCPAKRRLRQKREKQRAGRRGSGPPAADAPAGPRVACKLKL